MDLLIIAGIVLAVAWFAAQTLGRKKGEYHGPHHRQRGCKCRRRQW
jgi:hypothetical protein